MKHGKDAFIGWWTTDPTRPIEGREPPQDARRACKYTPDGNCPYKRPGFDCKDCEIAEDQVLPRI